MHRSGGKELNERHCPACGQLGSRGLGEKNNFRMLSCESCDTLYAATLPEVNAAQDYDDYYSPENLNVPAFIDTILDEIVGTFEPYRKNSRLLDVGCGAGNFLEAARRARWQAIGVEISRIAAAHVSSLGFDVFSGELEKANYPAEHFDVVIASEVLEHVPLPNAMLAQIARVLRPGGLLWATTPHGRGISARILGLEWSIVCPPEHLQLFSRKGIRRMLSGAGLGNATLASHGANPFEILHSWCPAEPNQGAENGVGAPAFDRVESTYQLGQFLRDSPSRRLLKGALNGVLRLTGLGDTLKIRAEK
jgi:SAM-dependent methyltransferase